MTNHELVQSTYNAVGASYAARYGDTPFLLTQIEGFATTLSEGACVLDVGCGAGRAARWFTQHGYPVTAVDFSSTMLDLAHEAAPIAKISHMDMRSLTFDDAIFDAVWSCFSFVHVSKADGARTLREWHRVLRPGGALFIATSLGTDEEGLRDEWLAASDGSTGHQIFFHHIAPTTLTRALEVAGFTAMQTEILYDEEEMGDKPILVVRAKCA
jgi:ubiquinone/menaquinone biosynthesis C-methylase UbiE